jgi:conjugative relaxase-like TrwC/TraI family protein
MLNIGKLVRDQADYYLDAVARSQEEYYTGAGEAPGYWLGGGAAELGLQGRVSEQGLRRMLDGAHPQTGGELAARSGGVRVAGYDLTFRAPKSVSLLYGLGSPQVTGQVRRAHEQAIVEALGYLERHAAIVSRGHARQRQELAGGLVAAAYPHRTSRAGDPLLHTHVLVANLGQGSDGRWTALDGRALYAHVKTAGYLYQAVLRGELARRLGVAWGPVRQGAADVAGVPRAVVVAFSQRREQIRQWLDEAGCHSARAAQAAALATRPAKEPGVGEGALRGRWRDQAGALGFTPDQLARCLQQADPTPLEPADVGAITQRLVSAEGLTLRVSTFTRRDVLRGICEALGGGGNVAEIERLADQFLASTAQVRLIAHGRRRPDAGGPPATRGLGGLLPVDQRSYSTAELLEVEAAMVAGALRRRGEGVGVVPSAVLDQALRRHTRLAEEASGGSGRPARRLDREQLDLVRALVASGDGVQLVNAKAGAGKTFALGAARRAWEAAGYRVVGAALAARAAQELRDGAGIRASTLARLLVDVQDPRHGSLDARTVLVVDEGGMVGTRTLARLLGLAEVASAKVVLCGDVAQLPEIDAGGAFRALCARLGAVGLDRNRRQQAPWERDALDALRRGDAAAAIARYLEHGRVIVGRRSPTLRRRLVTDWWQAAQRPGEELPVMLAARRADVADLNARARAMMMANGRLGPQALRIGGREFAVGDRILTLRNSYRLGILNGTRATVLAVDQTSGSLGIRTDDGRTVQLPRWYLHAWARCWVDHGYAMTGTKAQGMTCDRAFVLGTDELYREWGYVAMSRARLESRLYVAVGDLPADAADLDLCRQPATEPILELTRTLERSHGKLLALDQRTPSADAIERHRPAAVDVPPVQELP